MMPTMSNHPSDERDAALARFAHYQPSAALRDDSLDRILAARARGERRVLPAEAPAARHSAARPWIVSAIAATILTAVLLLARISTPPSATAGELSGTLIFAPAQPEAGAHVTVRYDPPPALGGASTLRLRARYRTRWSDAYNHGSTQSVVALLSRQPDGNFAGSFTLPRNVVYAAFAVEDSTAAHVDAHGDRLWELLVYRDGKPTAEALAQEFNDVLARSPDSALSIVRRATDLYPDDPRAWGARVAFESYMLGGTYLDSVSVEHVRRLRALDGMLRRQNDVSPDAMEGMRDYAVQIGSPAHSTKDIATYWGDRLAHDPAGGMEAAYYRMSQLNTAVLRDSTRAPAALDTVEHLWSAGDSLSSRVAAFGFQIARAAHDSTAVFHWLARLGPSEHDAFWYRYETLARRDPEYRDAVLARLRSLIASYERPDDRYRDLTLTVAADARQRAEMVRQALVSLGELLLERGDTAAALDTLRRTIDHGWDVQRFERVAAMFLRTRDTVNAARVYALVAADPATPRAHADSLAATFARALGDDNWRALVGSAGQEMTRRIMTDAISRPLPGTVTVSDAGGASVRLASLTHGRVSVLAFWSRSCGASRMQMPLLPPMQRTLEAHGAVLVPLTTEAYSLEIREYLRDAHVELTSYYDDRGQARLATNDISTPTYYVLDAAGRVRFEGHSPTLAITQAVALQRQ
ncbi:MAG TPA: TlpA disulfide reductase family protein [Gemmatimonadaceae bacterium]|nr:TlpA disulfide reductase family protein [Gemmatimonadaceae bacterium]